MTLRAFLERERKKKREIERERETEKKNSLYNHIPLLRIILGIYVNVI